MLVLIFFDTGDVYADGEGERIIGRALKNNGKRHDILIATKVDHGEPQPGLPHGFAQSHLTKKIKLYFSKFIWTY